MGIKHSISFSSLRLIELHSSHLHLPFHMPPQTYFPPHSMQTMNHPLIALIVLTNRAPPISSTNHSPLVNSPPPTPSLSCECGSQPYTFPSPFDNPHVGHFPPSTISTCTIVHDQAPQPTPFLLCICNLHLKPLATHVCVNLPFKGEPTNIPIKHPIHLIQTIVTILIPYFPLLPLHLH
jgi:hypothetical protein